MLALYRCGRQSDALRAFQTARSTLIDEFGVEPGAALLALERAVLDRDPALEASHVPLVPGASSHQERFLSAAGDEAAHFLSVAGGREAELAELRSDLQSAVSGHGRAAIISGEPGIGKTWLAEQLAQAAAAAGAVVVWDAATPAEVHPRSGRGCRWSTDCSTDSPTKRCGVRSGSVPATSPRSFPRSRSCSRTSNRRHRRIRKRHSSGFSRRSPVSFVDSPRRNRSWSSSTTSTGRMLRRSSWCC